MTPEQAAEHLRVIRQLMERPVRHTTRSGLAGIVAGVLALVGSLLTWQILPPRAEWVPVDSLGMYTRLPNGALLAIGGVWLGVLVVASAADILIVWRRARRRGETWWRREQLQTALAIIPGFFLAAMSTWLADGPFLWSLVPFGWMIGYGMAMWTVGMFSIVEVKVLAAAFLVAGWAGVLAVAMGWQGEPPLWFIPLALAVTFGGFHLVYGAVVWKRHGG